MRRFQIILQTAEGRRQLLIESSSNGESEGFRYQGQELVDGAIVTFEGASWLVSVDTDTEAPWPRFVCSPVRSGRASEKPVSSLALTRPRPSARAEDGWGMQLTSW